MFILTFYLSLTGIQKYHIYYWFYGTLGSLRVRSFHGTVNKTLQWTQKLSFYLNVLIDLIDKGKEKPLQLFFQIVKTVKSQQHCGSEPFGSS